MRIGMDSSWFASLEDAMRDSMAWDGTGRTQKVFHKRSVVLP